MHKKSNRWYESSFREIVSETSISNAVKYHNLVVVLSEDDILNALVKLTIQLVCKCASESARDHSTTQLNKSVNQFVSNILEDLVKVIGQTILN